MHVRISYGGDHVSTANDWNLESAKDLLCTTNEDLRRILECGTKAEACFSWPEAIGPRCTLQISWGLGVACCSILHRSNLFYSIYFPIIIYSVGRVRALNSSSATVPFTFVHCDQNEVAPQTITSPSIPWYKGSDTAGWKNPLAFMPWNWWHWQIKWIKFLQMAMLSIQNPSEWSLSSN